MSIFIIAEIGINHNGDIEIAKKLIDLAKACGCDAVKFQKRTIEIVYPKEVLDAPRESPWGTTNRDQKMHLEFGQKEYEIINNYCREKQIEWFASAWDIESLKFLRQFNLKYNKIASAMMVWSEFLEEVAKEGKHTFISTAMCNKEMIDNAVGIFRKRNCPIELMHCVATYPTQNEDANLRKIVTLRELYKCNVGYSGHEVSGVVISLAAVVLGATSIERHLTLDRTMYGSDQAASLEINGLFNLISSIRIVEKAMGKGEIGITEKEIPIAKKLRAYIPGR